MKDATNAVYGPMDNVTILIPAPDMDGPTSDSYTNPPMSEIITSLINNGADPAQIVYLDGNNSSGAEGIKGQTRLRDMMNAIDSVNGANGEINLVGHSNGANIAGRVAAENPEGIGNVILIDPSLSSEATLDKVTYPEKSGVAEKLKLLKNKERYEQQKTEIYRRI